MSKKFILRNNNAEKLLKNSYRKRLINNKVAYPFLNFKWIYWFYVMEISFLKQNWGYNIGLKFQTSFRRFFLC